MAKRSKQQSKATQVGESTGKPALATGQCHSPVKQPTLLAVSVILFVLWFVFLLVTALVG